MKNRMSAMVLFFLVSAACLAGCGNRTESEQNTGSSAEEANHAQPGRLLK